MLPSAGHSGHLPGTESVSLPPLQTQQEVAMLLVHNLPQPSPLGLPARVLLDLATESHGPGYRRALQVRVDDKQVCRWGSAGGASGSWGRGVVGVLGTAQPKAQVSQSSPRAGVGGADVHSAARARLPVLHAPAQHPRAADAVAAGQAGPAGQPRRAPAIMETRACVRSCFRAFTQQMSLEVRWMQGGGGTRFRLPSEPQSSHLDGGDRAPLPSLATCP